MGSIHDNLQVGDQIEIAQSELRHLEKQDERLGALVRQADELREAVAKELGKLSHEHLQARTMFLFLADARGDCMASITRTRVHIAALEEARR